MTESGRAVGVVETRVDTLRALVDDAWTKAGLVDHLGVSRSTVDRAVHELTVNGYVTPDDDAYRATLHGRLALQARDRLVDRLAAFDDAAGFLTALSPSFDVAPAVFEDATLVEATPRAPFRPIECIARLVGRASHVSAYSSRYVSRHGPVYHRRIVEAGMTATFVVTERVVERAFSEGSDDLQAALDLGRLAVYLARDSHPVSVISAETPTGPEMGMVVYAEQSPLGYVGTDASGAVAWANEFVARMRERADPLDPRD